MKLFLPLLVAASLAAKSSLNDYISYAKQYSFGKVADGEIELILDRNKITTIENLLYAELLKQGYSHQDSWNFSRVGITAEDSHYIWIRDAVQFPSGKFGLCSRAIKKAAQVKEIAILPLFDDNSIALVLRDRHTTRSWELEIPRGSAVADETLEQAAARELTRFTGLKADNLSKLGQTLLDSGTLSTAVAVMLAPVTTKKDEKVAPAEAGMQVLYLGTNELSQALLQGVVTAKINGKEKTVFLRDPLLTFGMIQCILQKKLHSQSFASKK